MLSELLHHDPPPPVIHVGQRMLVMTQQPTHDELIGVAFDEIRRAGAEQPAVSMYVLGAIASIVESLEAVSLSDRGSELSRQAQLVVDGSTEVLSKVDADLVRRAHAEKFA